MNAKHKRVKLMATETAPSGLTYSQLGAAHDELLANALSEIDAVLEANLREQIAQNKHFFINLPFPLSLVGREAATPCFAFNDGRVSAISALLAVVLEHFGVPAEEVQSTLAAANVICREYSPGNKISFHVDELECGPRVFGLILDNQDAQLRGLNFRLGQGKRNEEQCFVLRETRGTIFQMQDAARYKWKHGLPPVSARRVSVTVRFFKPDVLKKWHSRAQRDEATAEIDACAARSTASTSTAISGIADNSTTRTNAVAKEPTATTVPTEAATALSSRSLLHHQPTTRQSKVNVTLKNNSNQTKQAVVLVSTNVALEAMQKLAKNKLRIRKKAQKIVLFQQGGAALKDGDSVCNGDTIFVAAGEKYAGPLSEKVSADGAESRHDAIFESRLIGKMFVDWNEFAYGRLQFECTQVAQTPEFMLKVPQNDRFAVARCVEFSVLTVPEIRTLLETVGGEVDARNDLIWLFASGMTNEERRVTRVGIANERGEALIFSVTAERALKGAKKRDGPLWRIADDRKDKSEMK